MARQNEYASLPDLVAGHYAHPTVTAHEADALWRNHGTDYHVSGDQSLREHGRRGMRQAGRPGAELVRRSRLGHRRVIASGILPHPLTVDELARLGLTKEQHDA